MPASTATRRASRPARRRQGSHGDSDRLTALHETLTAGVAALVDGDAWRAMLAAGAHFHRYSFSNLLLIYLARPDATRVAGIRTWNRLGRRVRKGEHGIPILAPCLYRADPPPDGAPPGDEPDREPSATADGKPRRVPRGFRVVYVFDIAQTDGDPVPDVAPVLLDGDDPGRLYDALAAQVAAAGYTLHRADIPIDGANGLTDYLARSVTVRPDVSDAQACKTLAHELAHVLLHHPDDGPAPTRDRAEVEAESVAYVVCHAAGLGTADYSLPYVARWADGDLALIRASAERVVATARRVLDQLAADTGALADVTAPGFSEVES